MSPELLKLYLSGYFVANLLMLLVMFHYVRPETFRIDPDKSLFLMIVLVSTIGLPVTLIFSIVELFILVTKGLDSLATKELAIKFWKK